MSLKKQYLNGFEPQMHRTTDKPWSSVTSCSKRLLIVALFNLLGLGCANETEEEQEAALLRTPYAPSFEEYIAEPGPFEISADINAQRRYAGRSEPHAIEPIESIVEAGNFTFTVPVRLDKRSDRTVILSNWNVSEDTRGMEVGVDGWQRVYVQLSNNGLWDKEDKDAYEVVHSTQTLRLGRTTLVSIRVDTERNKIAIYLGPEKVTEQHVEVAKPFAGGGSFWFGGRPKTKNTFEHQFSGVLGHPMIFDVAPSDEQLQEFAIAAGYASPPPLDIPVTALTKGPGFHWFGYYDKFETDPTDRYVLGMRIDFENRAPKAEDVVVIGMIDTQNENRWIELGTTRAWNWQQGCMLQWRPGSPNEVLWNDREDGRFVTRVHDISSGSTRTLPAPIYHVAPDGKIALGLDFARLDATRPGYGYEGVADPASNIFAPASSTIYSLDLDTGELKDLVTVKDIAEIPHDTDLSERKHYFNVIQWAPDGSRFSFLHRWLVPRWGFGTRMFVSSPDGSTISLLSQVAGLSHSYWRDPSTQLIWNSKYFGYSLYRDGEGYVGTVLTRRNGHQSYLPDTEFSSSDWLVTDTYPDDQRNQLLYLYHIPSDEVFLLGTFPSPPAYRGEWRVDLHPRISRDGTKIFIDSAHNEGRQLYSIDISEVLAWPK